MALKRPNTLRIGGGTSSGGIWGQNYVGQNKRVTRGILCFKNLKKNWQKIFNFRWGIALNCPAVIPLLGTRLTFKTTVFKLPLIQKF
jgi:hypothetical protein